MPTPIPITDFSGGELTPRMRGRTEAPLYLKGLNYSKNYTSIPFGGITRRPGTWRIDEITSDFTGGSDALMIPYPSSTQDDVMLVVWQNASDDICLLPIIFDSPITVGTKRTLANPYPGEVNNKTKWARVPGSSEIFLAGELIKPFTITNGATTDSWTIAFSDYALPAWDQSEYYAPGDLVSYSSSNYIAIENSTDHEANVGVLPTETDYWDAYGGPIEPGFIVNATGTDAEKATWYPSCVVSWMGRIIYAGSQVEPTALWGSGVRQYGYFVLGLNDSSPFKHTLSSSDSGQIHWLVSGDVLVAGTGTAEFVISGNQFGITPSSIQVATQTAHGSSPVQPVLFNEQILFSKSDKQQIYGLSYTDALARFYARHLSSVADHIHKSQISAWAMTRSPRPSLLSITGDGRIVQMIYDKEMQQTAFYPWETDGASFVSIGTLPNDDGEDRIVAIVKRGTEYYVELFNWIDYAYHETASIGSSNDYKYGMYLDSATEITISEDADGFYASGLSAYEGETIDLVIGNAPHASQVVDSGIVRLDHNGDFGYAGYGYESVGQTMNMPPAMITKRINQFGIRFIDTVGGLVGPSYEEMETIIFRDGVSYYDTELELFSGDQIVDNVGGFDRETYIWFSQNQPLPQTILQIVAWTERYE